MAIIIACHDGISMAEPGLKIKKGELLRNSLYISHLDQSQSFLVGLTLKKVPSDVYILGNLKYATIFR